MLFRAIIVSCLLLAGCASDEFHVEDVFSKTRFYVDTQGKCRDVKTGRFVKSNKCN